MAEFQVREFAEASRATETLLSAEVPRGNIIIMEASRFDFEKESRLKVTFSLIGWFGAFCDSQIVRLPILVEVFMVWMAFSVTYKL